jgi:tripartite-type tricarboxylate transporter receptor subunit TctC
VPHVLLVNNDLAVKSVPELIQLAKKNRGSSTSLHRAAARFRTWRPNCSSIWRESTCCTYRTAAAPAILDLIGGRVQVMFDSIASSLPHIRAGKLRAIAVASNTRSSLLPNVPTVAESDLRATGTLLARHLRAGGHAGNHRRAVAA